MTLTAIVVGCGRIGSGFDDHAPPATALTHAGAYMAHPEISLVGGVDTREEKRAQFARRWRVPAVGRLEEALELRPDIVSIATPADVRLEIVERVLAARPRAIWIEKPLARDVEEASALVGAARTAGVTMQVNFHRRFDPLHRRIAHSLESERRQAHLDVQFSGSFENFGSHAVDLFRWWIGEPQSAVRVDLGAGRPAVVLRSEAGGTGTLVQVRGGETTVFEAAVTTPAQRIVVGGVGAEAVTFRKRASSSFPGVSVYKIDQEGIEGDGIAGAMTAGAEALVSHLRRGVPLPCAGDDGLAVVRIQQLIARAAAGDEVGFRE